MDPKKALKLLRGARGGITEWNRLRANEPDAALCVDLGCADLSGVDLRTADLRAANLSHANLSGADLSRANLTDTNV